MRSYVPPPIFIPAPATIAGEIVVVCPSLGLEDVNSAVPALNRTDRRHWWSSS